MVLITKAEMKHLFQRRLIEYPPFRFDGKVYAWKIECEDTPPDLVWCDE